MNEGVIHAFLDLLPFTRNNSYRQFGFTERDLRFSFSYLVFAQLIEPLLSSSAGTAFFNAGR
jgi:hypothetical protein